MTGTHVANIPPPAPPVTHTITLTLTSEELVILRTICCLNVSIPPLAEKYDTRYPVTSNATFKFMADLKKVVGNVRDPLVESKAA